MSNELAGQTKHEQRGLMDALTRYMARFDDGEVLRWAFRGLLAGTIGVLGMDFYEMYTRVPEPSEVAAPEILTPLLPPVSEPGEPSGDPRTQFTGDREALRKAMTFTLGAGGVLEATGAIDPGAKDRLNAELELRGEYVKVVALNSPGGSLEDAMAMGRLLRENKVTTEVADGALCASSCPLILAGGQKRLVGEKAAVGVHQFYAVAGPAGSKPQGPAGAMSDAQATTARISRYLSELDVDPALWLHAMDTPPQSLYYFSPEELTKYKLSTGKPAPEPARS